MFYLNTGSMIEIKVFSICSVPRKSLRIRNVYFFLRSILNQIEDFHEVFRDCYDFSEYYSLSASETIEKCCFWTLQNAKTPIHNIFFRYLLRIQLCACDNCVRVNRKQCSDSLLVNVVKWFPFSNLNCFLKIQ